MTSLAVYIALHPASLPIRALSNRHVTNLGPMPVLCGCHAGRVPIITAPARRGYPGDYRVTRGEARKLIRYPGSHPA